MKISFGIKTNLRNEIKTLLTILSIREQGISISDYEILITGCTNFTHLDGLGLDNVRLLPDQASADAGKLGFMMNTLASQARFDAICLMDDDIIITDGWYTSVCKWIEKKGPFDALSFPIRNTDGSRHFDWAAVTPAGARLLPYTNSDRHGYITGGFVLFRKELWRKVQWDGARGFYQREDYDWSMRLKSAGFAIGFCPIAFVIHNDWRLAQCGINVKDFSCWEDRITALTDTYRYIDNGLFSIWQICTYFVRRIIIRLGGIRRRIFIASTDHAKAISMECNERSRNA